MYKFVLSGIRGRTGRTPETTQQSNMLCNSVLLQLNKLCRIFKATLNKELSVYISKHRIPHRQLTLRSRKPQSLNENRKFEKQDYVHC
jgi:hypothetical protein